jgi:hypothetical protein
MRLLLILCAALYASIAGAAVEGTTARVFVEVRGPLFTGVQAIGAETAGAVIHAEGIEWELDFAGDANLARTAQELSGQEVRASGALEIHCGPERHVRHVISVTGLRPSVVPFTVAYSTSTEEAEACEMPLEISFPARPVEMRELRTRVDTSDLEPRGYLPPRYVERSLDWWEPSKTLDAPFRE